MGDVRIALASTHEKSWDGLVMVNKNIAIINPIIFTTTTF